METKRRKRRVTAREGAAITGLSPRHVRRLVAQPRAEWLAEKAREREEIRAYHDEGGHTWQETADHFGLNIYTVQQRAYRARKERAAEQRAKSEPTLPLDELTTEQACD